MNKPLLIESISKSNKYLLKEDAAHSVNLIMDLISESLSNGDRVEIRGFGSFSVRGREERIARNPKTGTSIKVEKKFHPYFRASSSLRDVINK